MMKKRNRWLVLFTLICSLLIAYEVEAKHDKCVLWVLDYTTGEVVKLFPGTGREPTRLGGFNAPRDFDINYIDDTVLVVDTGSSQVVRVSSDAKTMLNIHKDFIMPVHVSVCSKDNTFWITDQEGGKVVKLSSDGKKRLLEISDFVEPHDIKVNPYDSSVWVTDFGAKKIVKLSTKGEILAELGGFKRPGHLAVNVVNGICWVLDSGTQELIRISADGKKILSRSKELGTIFKFALSPLDNTCWIIGEGNSLFNLSSDGKTTLIKVEGFERITAISEIDPEDGSFWVGDEGSSGQGEIIKISATGEKLAKIKGFYAPQQIIKTEE